MHKDVVNLTFVARKYVFCGIMKFLYYYLQETLISVCLSVCEQDYFTCCWWIIV